MNLVNLTYNVLSTDVEYNMTINQQGQMTINTFLPKESSEYYMQVIVSFDDGSGKFTNMFLNKTVEICKFLSTRSYETFMQLYYKKLMKYENNIPTVCPLGGSVSTFLYFV